MTKKITIVDYGIGNLFSVGRAIEAAGGEAVLATSYRQVAEAERILLPGVGAFEPCARTLREKGLADGVLAFAQTGRPFLGICVGMQLLFDYSMEFGEHEGLGLIPGHVGPISVADDYGNRKVPHIGWNSLNLPEGRGGWGETVLEGCRPGSSSFYFVHSFNCIPNRSEDILARSDYEGYPICAAVHSENIVAFQCHPEKSGQVGLQVLRNFLTI